jgi:nucleoside-diphosphate-sugar epimerase
LRVLVIGGSGLFGRKTIASLLPDPEVSCVVSMDLNPVPKWSLLNYREYTDKLHYVRGDVSSLEDILNVIRVFSVDVLVNWAFIMGGELDENPRLSAKVNNLGMSNVFEAARLSGIERIIYASSETVYGSQDDYGDREVNEDDRLYPAHAYALSKRLAEIQAEQYSRKYGINCTGVRGAVIIGHGAKARLSKLFSDIISLPAAGKPIVLDIDGLSLFSLVSADDVGEFTHILLQARSSPHPVYNLGGPPFSFRDVAAKVRQFIPQANITFGSQPVSGPGQQGMPWMVSCERAKTDFGFEFLQMEEAIKIHIRDARAEAGLEPLDFKESDKEKR